MKKVMILLMVAVFVTTVPAFGGGGKWIGTTGSFHDGANWDSGSPPGPGEGFNIRNGGTCQVYEGDADISGSQIRVGYWKTESGHVEINADITFTCAPQGILPGEYLSRILGFEMGTFTQNNGTVITDYISNGRNDGDSNPGMGYGGYIITGGTLDCGLIRNGDDQATLPADKGMGLFKVVGDTPVIDCTDYIQNVLSTTEIVLTAAGNISLINASGDATLEGTLLVDVNGFSGVKTIDVLTAGGTLDYTELSCAYDLSDDGAGTLQVTVPEPMTLTLLGLGGLGILIRRKRR